MNNKLKNVALIIGLATTNIALADNVLTGKTKLACEAILCLSTGSPPNQCTPSLTEYFSIDFDDFGDTIQGRLDFLNLCPVSAQTPEMKSLVTSIANGAGRCDAASLNATLLSYSGVSGNFMNGIGRGCITGTKPSYCAAYENHVYTRITGAHYVIDPPTNNYWPFNGGGNIMNGYSGNNFGNYINGGGNNGVSNQTCGHWVN